MRNKNQLLERICNLQENGETGLLRLENGANEIKVYFQDGLIDAASTDIAQLQLGRFLSGRSFVEGPGVDRLVVESRRKHIPLGRAAVAQKLLDGMELKDLVREQVVQVLTHALDNDFEERSFAGSSTSFFVPARLDLNRLLLELARHNLTPYRVEPNKLIGLRNGRNLSCLPWYPEELSVLGELKRPRTLQDLAANTGLEYRRLGKILCVLDALQLITVVQDAPAETTAVVRQESFPFEHLTPEIRKSGLSDKLETVHNESSFVSEQFKNLKVRIGEVASGRPLRVLTVSSPHTGDGKTLISANLAASCSKDRGRRVIIVDCDLRNPSLHKFLGISLEPGLLGYFRTGYLQPYCYMRRYENLYLMTAGGIAPDPVELLTHAKMRQLIDCLKVEFDTIILDSPPFAPIADAQILTSLSDGLILVIRCGKTSYSRIEKAYRNLDQGKLVGLVLNDVKPMAFNTQYDYKYYHYKYCSHYPYAARRIPRRSKTYLEQ